MVYTEEQKARRREATARWRRRNPEKCREMKRRWRRNNRTLASAQDFKKKYGITRDEKIALFVAQGGKCAICGSEDPGGVHGWHTDHCHKTRQVRGVLCRSCNTGLGKFKDSPAVLRAAANYLEK